MNINDVEVHRGEIFYILNGETGYTGSEMMISQGRPGVIVSNDIGNKNASIVSVVFLTTKVKNSMPTHVPIKCKCPSIAMCEQVYTISKKRIGDYIGKLTDEEMAAINEALSVSLGIHGSLISKHEKTYEELQIECDMYQKWYRDILEVLKMR